MHSPTRRTVLGASIAAAGSGLLAGCSGSDSPSGPGSHPGPGEHQGSGHGGRPFVPRGPKGYVNPSDPEVLAVERKRGSGPVRSFRLTAAETTLDLGGRTVRSWAYGDSLPGREVRIKSGDILDLNLTNHLPVSTTLHSHGVRMRCDMDGVPGLTQHPIRPGDDFNYRFAVDHPGTYWLHSHSGLQLDRGLYAPLIVEDPREPLSYDKEWVVILDDWVDGVAGSTPDGVLAQLLDGKGMATGMGMGEDDEPGGKAHDKAAHEKPHGPSRVLRNSHSRILHSEGGSVDYPFYLVNGRLPKAPSVFRARKGDRIRLRIINAGAETAFRVALGGHEMTITHTDGYPVEHTQTDALLLGMAERYDVLITAKDGVFPLVALAEGKNARALAVLRTGSGDIPRPSVHPDELDGKLVPARRLVPDDSVALTDDEPDRELRIRLTGGMKKFDWAFDHRPYSVEQRHPVSYGERIRLTLINATDMWHPMHLHGHTFALTGFGVVGARKDTAHVVPHHKLVVDFYADNPGLWMLHCHNQYHSESGMMTILGYRK
ncbi:MULTISPECIES: multicopper oxidase family protein [Streptomyces]|uniref:Multicopper oxidase family protein n=1 Tax=Streptomyces mirabilis TaxID=68239 RepID=A0ABU3UN07_9ACTN|nr:MULTISPECIES: multicopper oxidase family protein [Streptomyces]KAF5995176.1 copper oxidase [Streptomyces sp. WAC00263]MCX4421827.1 multicopper oxidase family protein [Streptomyces mirabilis]MCX5351604.1 multicopper oxidase family protein [Streptomyces mirabilis]MDU8994914.1 multicopper oxidase family protein [Streptomyces mirabilis]NMI60577.1 multicopper oxidase family protein [Streptomyces sp. RLA2-12]